MLYRDSYIMTNPMLDPGDMYILSTTIGPPLMVVMDYVDMQLGNPARETSRQATLVAWFSALVAVRIAEVVDFDAYEGDLASEQLADYQIAWPNIEAGHEPRAFIETLWRLQDEGVGLNFIDLLVGELCREFLCLQENGEAPTILGALNLADQPDAAAMIPVIDRLLYTAGIPLTLERYTMLDERGIEHRWKLLAEGALSNTRRLLSFEELTTFQQMRSDPVMIPPDTGHLCHPPLTYCIELAKEPTDD